MGGVGIYLVVIAVIAVLYFALARLSPSSSSYSYSNFLWDVQNGYVSSVLIKQNSEVPTGVLSITKTDNGEELLNVSDVHEIEQLLLDNNIRYTLKDVTRDSVWITTILPFGICLVIIIVIMMMTNRQAGGGGGAKMMNFGKSRAKLMNGTQNPVTFKDVAGLQEEKEELELLPQTDKELLDKIVNFINNHLDNPDLTVDSLVEEAGISRSALFKKIKTLIGISPMELIKNIRLKKAAELVKEGSCNFTQIAYKTGFNDSQYFSKCFKKQMGVTPTEYKDKQKQ